MKKALVLGASGGMGYSIVKELSSRGTDVIAFARTKERLEQLFQGNPRVTIFAGDIFRKDDLEAAAAGVDVIFHAANLPYPQWKEKLAQMMRNVLETAEKQSTKLAIVDNIYAYSRSAGKKVSESSPKNPHTQKGKIRLEVEGIVNHSKVKSLTVHFPDFYGPNAMSTLLHFTLQGVVHNKKTSYVGDPKIAREFIYTPDGAKAIVDLALTEEAYGKHWNIPAYDVITGEEVIEIIREITDYNKKVSTVTKNMIKFIGFFNSNMREAVEMFYLNEEPIVLSGEQYEKQIGSIPRTSYKEGLAQTIQYMKKQMTI